MQDFEQGNNGPQGGPQNEQTVHGAAAETPNGQQRPYQPQENPQAQRPYQPQGGQQPRRPQPARGGMPPFRQPPKKNGMKMACIIIPIVLLVLGVIACVAIFFGYKYLSENKPDLDGISIENILNGKDSESEDFDEPQVLSTYEAMDELGELDLSLSKIQAIENNCLNDGTDDEEQHLKARVIALKHIYTEAFLTEEHSLQSLKNIYMLHAGEFSEEQRDVLKNFFSLPAREQQLWEMVEGKVENFEDFVTKMDEKVSAAAAME